MTAKPTQVLRLPVVKARTGLSRTGIYDRIRSHNFPAPISLGGRVVAWVEADVEAWLEARIAFSRTQQVVMPVNGEASKL